MGKNSPLIGNNLARLETLYKRARIRLKTDITPMFVDNEELSLSYCICKGGKAVEQKHDTFTSKKALNEGIDALTRIYPNAVIFRWERDIQD